MNTTTTSILNTLLILAIVWVSMAILYLIVGLVTHLVTKCRFEIRYRKRKKEFDELSKKEEAAFSLVGRSRPYIPSSPSNDFPIVPATSSPEKAVENIDTFALELPESLGNSDDVTEEDNELQIDYSDDMEEVDAEQEEREALLIFEESTVPEAPHSGGVLVKELALLQRTSQKEELEEEADAVRETITKLQGTDFMEQYKKNMAHFNVESKGIMKLIREVETKEVESQSSLVVEVATADSSEVVEEHPLSYYL